MQRIAALLFGNKSASQQKQEQAKKDQAQAKIKQAKKDTKFWNELGFLEFASISKVQKRLEEGGNPNCYRPNATDPGPRRKPLEFVIAQEAFNKDIDLARTLIANHANVNQQVNVPTASGQAHVVPLVHFALLRNRADMVNLLLTNNQVAITDYELKQMQADLKQIPIPLVQELVPEHERRQRVMRVALLGREAQAQQLSQDLKARVRNSITTMSFINVQGRDLIQIVVDYTDEPTSSMLYPSVEVIE